MSLFDAASFLDATTTEASSRRPPIPAGSSLVGIIGDLKPPREQQGTKPDNRDKTYYFMDVPITFDLTAYPQIREVVGVDKVTISDSLSLDLNAAGHLDMSPGKNARLFRYREALGMNVPGQAFSLRAMTGRMVTAKIKHEPYQGEIYDKIDSVAKV